MHRYSSFWEGKRSPTDQANTICILPSRPTVRQRCVSSLLRRISLVDPRTAMAPAIELPGGRAPSARSGGAEESSSPSSTESACGGGAPVLHPHGRRIRRVHGRRARARSSGPAAAPLLLRLPFPPSLRPLPVRARRSDGSEIRPRRSSLTPAVLCSPPPATAAGLPLLRRRRRGAGVGWCSTGVRNTTAAV